MKRSLPDHPSNDQWVPSTPPAESLKTRAAKGRARVEAEQAAIKRAAWLKTAAEVGAFEYVRKSMVAALRQSEDPQHKVMADILDGDIDGVAVHFTQVKPTGARGRPRGSRKPIRCRVVTGPTKRTWKLVPREHIALFVFDLLDPPPEDERDDWPVHGQLNPALKDASIFFGEVTIEQVRDCFNKSRALLREFWQLYKQ